MFGDCKCLKVTAKYQITMPPDVRKYLCINPGSKVDIVKEDDRFVLVVNLLEDIKKVGAENLKTDKP